MPSKSVVSPRTNTSHDYGVVQPTAPDVFHHINKGGGMTTNPNTSSARHCYSSAAVQADTNPGVSVPSDGIHDGVGASSAIYNEEPQHTRNQVSKACRVPSAHPIITQYEPTIVQCEKPQVSPNTGFQREDFYARSLKSSDATHGTTIYYIAVRQLAAGQSILSNQARAEQII